MINQRGYANVVPSNGDWVEGLVFEIDSEDERRLDKNEGIEKLLYVEGKEQPIPCYKKDYKNLTIHRAQKSLFRRPVRWIVEKGGVARVLAEAEKEGDSVRPLCSMKKENVLMYASPDFVKNGNPKEEYIKRINSGVSDARALGMTQMYIERFIRTSIPPDGQATTGSRAYPVKEETQTQTQTHTGGARTSRGQQRIQEIERTAVRQGPVRQGHRSAEDIQVQQDRALGRNSERPSAFPRPRSQSQTLGLLPDRPNGRRRLLRSLSPSRRNEERQTVRVVEVTILKSNPIVNFFRR